MAFNSVQVKNLVELSQRYVLSAIHSAHGRINRVVQTTVKERATTLLNKHIPPFIRAEKAQAKRLEKLREKHRDEIIALKDKQALQEQALGEKFKPTIEKLEALGFEFNANPYGMNKHYGGIGPFENKNGWFVNDEMTSKIILDVKTIYTPHYKVVKDLTDAYRELVMNGWTEEDQPALKAFVVKMQELKRKARAVLSKRAVDFTGEDERITR